MTTVTELQETMKTLDEEAQSLFCQAYNCDAIASELFDEICVDVATSLSIATTLVSCELGHDVIYSLNEIGGVDCEKYLKKINDRYAIAVGQTEGELFYFIFDDKKAREEGLELDLNSPVLL